MQNKKKITAVKIFRPRPDTRKTNINKPIPTIIVKEIAQISFVLKRFAITKAMKPTKKTEARGPNQRYLFASGIRNAGMYIKPIRVIKAPKAIDMDTACKYWISSFLINLSNKIIPPHAPYKKNNKKIIIPIGESNGAPFTEKIQIIDKPKRKDTTSQPLNSLIDLPERTMIRQKSSGTIRIVRRKVILIQMSEFSKRGLQ